MGFRVVMVKQRTKLELRLNYILCRTQNEEKKVFIPKIATLIFETTSISITTALLSELIKNDVKIIFCDEKHNPESELVPYHTSYNSFQKIQQQINWSEKIKGELWTKIIYNKIHHQQVFLEELKLKEQSALLQDYLDELEFNDVSLRVMLF